MGFAEMGICMEHVDILKPTTKFTLAMLADRADPFSDSEKTQRRTDGRVECWPSVTDLVHRTNQSKSTVLRQLKELEKLGIIEVEKRWRKDALGRARQTTNRYILNLPEMLEGKFRKGNCALGVKSTPKQSYPQNAGHGKSVDLTPIGGLGVKNADSMGVTVDTPIKDQGLTTIPSPQPPTSNDGGGEMEPWATAGPSVAEPSGSGGAEGDPYAVLGESDRLRQIALALDGRAMLPESVTVEELAEVRQLLARSEEIASERPLSDDSSSSDVITPAEVKNPSEATLEPENDAAGAPAGPQNGDTPESEPVSQAEPQQSQAELVALARAVLPGPMQALGAKNLAKLGDQIACRLEAGWTREQITQVLASRQLPSEIRNLVGLVMARLRDDAPVDDPPASSAAFQPAGAASSGRWSHTLADGRVITRADLDCGLLAVDYNAARSTGRWHSDDRMAFALSRGIEHYLST